MLALGKHLVGHLLCLRKRCLVMAYCKHGVACFRVYTLNDCGYKLAVMALKLCQYLTPFSLAHALTEVVF